MARTAKGATTAHRIGGGRDGGDDKDVVIDDESVDKDSLTEEAMALAVATPPAGWHSNDDKVVIDNDDEEKESDTFAVRSLFACCLNARGAIGCRSVKCVGQGTRTALIGGHAPHCVPYVVWEE
jgi:hypothetical protein